VKQFERWLRESADAASRRDVEIQRAACEMLEPMIAQLVERYAPRPTLLDGLNLGEEQKKLAGTARLGNGGPLWAIAEQDCKTSAPASVASFTSCSASTSHFATHA
jgi:hypothetical protein